MNSRNIYKQTSTPNETPLLIKEKLDEFNVALGKIDLEKRRGYLMAQERCPGECDQEFKLMFLRCEVFSVNRAVDRFIKYWNTRIEVFGETRAFLPMSINGAMKDDIEVIQMGYLQVACKTDPDGRAIILLDHQKEASEASTEALLRAVWYQVHVALRQTSAQRRGIVIYAQCLERFSDWRPSLSKQIALAGRGILPIRFAGMHFIHPPKFLSLIMPCVRIIVGKKLRNRFYTHSGSMDELQESLSRFGLGTKEMLPEMFGGKLEFV